MLDLHPDNRVLRHIFPQTHSPRTAVLAQSPDTCTFVAYSCGTSGEDVIVRLEIVESDEDSTRFRTVLTLQSLAKLALPDLVPGVERSGTTTTEDGRNISFSVTHFVVDTVTLESVWDDSEVNQQARIMNELVETVKKLHALQLTDTNVVNILQGTRFATGSEIIPIGGPNTGYFTDIRGLLKHIVKDHSHLTLDTVTGDATIHSDYEDINPVHLSSDNLRRLQDSAVLCHQDLEPRNVLVRAENLDNGKTLYHIAAIIDWEIGGFYPFSYEYVYKDFFLGSSNLYFSWYALFKELSAPLIPMDPLPPFHGLFMEAIELAHYSHERESNAMSSRIAKKWIAREGVVRQQPAGTGWSKQGHGLPNKRIPEAEMDKLVEEVLKERRAEASERNEYFK